MCLSFSSAHPLSRRRAQRIFFARARHRKTREASGHHLEPAVTAPGCNESQFSRHCLGQGKGFCNPSKPPAGTALPDAYRRKVANSSRYATHHCFPLSPSFLPHVPSISPYGLPRVSTTTTLPTTAAAAHGIPRHALPPANALQSDAADAKRWRLPYSVSCSTCLPLSC